MSEPIGWGADLTPDELAARLKAHPFAATREPLMQKIVLLVQGKAQERTPVRTGTLRRSETSRVDAGGLSGAVGTNIIYAPFVHRRVPFFNLAVDDSRAAAQKLLADAGDEYWKGIA